MDPVFVEFLLKENQIGRHYYVAKDLASVITDAIRSGKNGGSRYYGYRVLSRGDLESRGITGIDEGVRMLSLGAPSFMLDFPESMDAERPTVLLQLKNQCYCEELHKFTPLLQKEQCFSCKKRFRTSVGTSRRFARRFR